MRRWSRSPCGPYLRSWRGAVAGCAPHLGGDQAPWDVGGGDSTSSSSGQRTPTPPYGPVVAGTVGHRRETTAGQMIFERIAPVVPIVNLRAGLDRHQRLVFEVESYAGGTLLRIRRTWFGRPGGRRRPNDPEPTGAHVYIDAWDADTLHARWGAGGVEGRRGDPFDTSRAAGVPGRGPGRNPAPVGVAAPPDVRCTVSPGVGTRQPGAREMATPSVVRLGACDGPSVGAVYGVAVVPLPSRAS